MLALAVAFLFKACVPSRQDTPSPKPRASTEYWQLKTGSKIAYTHVKAQGEPKPYPVIYLHGGPGGYVHSKVIDVLGRLSEDGYDVYLYDQVGSGFSGRLDEVNEYTAARHQRDLEAIVEELKAPKVILVGQSWGGALATLFAADNPTKVEKLIFTCPGAMKPVEDSVEHLPAPEALHLKEPLDVNQETIWFALKPRYVAIRLWAFAGVKLASDDEADSYLNAMATQFTKGLVADPSHVATEEGGGGGYSNIKTPPSYRKLADPRLKLRDTAIRALVMKGQYDNIPWGNTHEYQEVFKNNELKIIENAGHDMYLDKPAEYVEAMRAFLRE